MNYCSSQATTFIHTTAEMATVTWHLTTMSDDQQHESHIEERKCFLLLKANTVHCCVTAAVVYGGLMWGFPELSNDCQSLFFQHHTVCSTTNLGILLIKGLLYTNLKKKVFSCPSVQIVVVVFSRFRIFYPHPLFDAVLG